MDQGSSTLISLTSDDWPEIDADKSVKCRNPFYEYDCGSNFFQSLCSTQQQLLSSELQRISLSYEEHTILKGRHFETAELVLVVLSFVLDLKNVKNKPMQYPILSKSDVPCMPAPLICLHFYKQNKKLTTF